tara:strand:+ start:12280 stop:13185 length:906 start_codon:yes stop_codon:yes gene_type:complete
MKKALVTGGAGFIGSWVVDYLIHEGFNVIVIDNLSTGSKDNLNKKAKFYELDIKDKNILEIFEKEKPEYVYHLAAQINVRESIKDPLEDSKTNVLGSLNILNSCIKHNVKKFIFSSTGGAIYGDDCKIPTSEEEKEGPLSPYGISKLTIEKYLKFYKDVYGLDYVSLRYSNVYGPRQNSKGEAGVVSIFINKLILGETPIINGSGKQTRDYIYVKDVAKANILALNLSGIFNVGTSKETNVNELFRKITENRGIQTKAIHGPEIKGEQMRSCLDSTKLIEKGWKIEYNLDKGLKETIEYFK